MQSLGAKRKAAGERVQVDPAGGRRALPAQPGPARTAGAGGRSRAPRDRRSPWARLVARFRAGEPIAPPRWTGALVTGLALAGVGLYGMSQGGHTPRVDDELRYAMNAWTHGLGLGVERVTISGLKELDDWEILEALDVDETKSLFTFDVGEARMKLEAIPWVRRAEVQKLYPHDLTVTVTEHDPFALWQSGGEVMVIDAEGRVLEPMEDPRFAQLPLVVGEGAAEAAPELIGALQEHRMLQARVRAAYRISERRWTLRLHDGIDVSLPESGLGEALAALSRLDRDSGLLSRDIVGVDLRLADRVVVRLSEGAMERRREQLENDGGTQT